MIEHAQEDFYGGCYLTIDDGPDATFEEKVNWLDKRGIKAIWYCQGNHLLQYEEVVVSAIKNGHIIGNHSYDHKSFEALNDEEAIGQLEQTQSIIDDLYRKAKRVNPLKTFRFPYLINGSLTYTRYMYENGFRHPLFKGHIPYEHGNDLYLSVPSVGTNFDTCDWKVINEAESYDETKCLSTLKEQLESWYEVQTTTEPDNRTYTVVLSHCFTKTPLFKQMIELMLDKGMIFELPSESMATHCLPIERRDEHHVIKHQYIMNHRNRDNVDLLLIGDSITRRWEDNEKIYEKYLGDYCSINMGVGGDTINNLLWRLSAGELDGLAPAYISLLIGTNSLPFYPDDAVIDGLKEIVLMIRTKCPNSKFIYNHIFPRNPDKDCDDYLNRILVINQVMKNWLPADVIQLSMVDMFLDGKITVTPDLMSDGLHIGEAGYHLWGQTLIKKLNS